MAQLVPAPVRKPRSGGIKDVVGEFVRQDRLVVAQGIAWEDAGCGLPSGTPAGCYDDVVEPEDKVGSEVGQYQSIGEPFALYKGVECWIGGDGEGDTYTQQAAAALEAGEDRRVEEKLTAWAGNAATTGTFDSLLDAIAGAEQAADLAYIGQPVIILNRADADRAYAARVLEREDGKLVTANGSPVLSTSMQPVGDVAAVGAIAVYASPVVSMHAQQLSQNVDMAIAERVYDIGVDCNFRYLASVDTTP